MADRAGAIVASIAAAYRQAAAAVGNPDFRIILEQPGARSGPRSDPVWGDPTLHALAGLDLDIQTRDEAGTLTGDTTRIVRLEAGVAVPMKGDRVNIGGALEEGVVTGGTWHEVDTVTALAPAGVTLSYALTLAT